MIAADLLVRRWLSPVNFNRTRRSIEHEKDKQGGNNAGLGADSLMELSTISHYNWNCHAITV